MKVNIVIPAYNEEEIIQNTLNNITLKLKLKHYRIIIVDDASSDRTPQIINNFSQTNPNTTVILNKIHRGYVNVLKQGFNIVEENGVIIPLMADGCDDIETIERMFYYIQRGFDLVCASRYIKGGKRIGGSLLKHVGSWVINKIFYFVSGKSCHDSTNSFKMFKKNILYALEIKSSKFEMFMELTIKAHRYGFKIKEVPTVWKERIKGKSKFKLYRDGLRYLKWLLFS